MNQKTVLISDIYLADKGGNPIGDAPLTDHIWFVAGKWSQTLKVGDRIAFNARVEKYEKGYKGYQAGYETPIEVDYCLKRPTKVEVIKIS